MNANWADKSMIDISNLHLTQIAAHLMDEAEFLCDRLAIIVNGRLRCVGSSSEVIDKTYYLWLDIYLLFYD